MYISIESVFNARVAQWWSIALPRRGSRVRIPSRAFFIGWNFLGLQGISAFCVVWDMIA